MHDKGPAVTCMAQQGKVHDVSNSMLIGCVLCRVGRVTRTTTAAPPKCSLRCAHLLCITTSSLSCHISLHSCTYMWRNPCTQKDAWLSQWP